MASAEPVLPWLQKIRRESNAKEMISLLKPAAEKETIEEKSEEKVAEITSPSPKPTSGPGFSKSKFDKFKADTEALLVSPAYLFFFVHYCVVYGNQFLSTSCHGFLVPSPEDEMKQC